MTYGRATNFTLVTNEKTLDSSNSNTVFYVYVAFIHVYSTYISFSVFLHVLDGGGIISGFGLLSLLLLQKFAAISFYMQPQRA